MIRIRDLCFSFPGASARALDRVSIDIGRGERVAVIGPNASGKTTLARCLNGLLLPDSGSVSVDDFNTRDRDSLPSLRRLVAMVFQNPDDQLVATTVEAEIAFGLENLGVPLPRMRQRVAEVLDRFALKRYSGHPPHLLSGGEKQRLAIAAGFALRPRYFVLDEPTSMLDSDGRAQLLDVIDELSSIQGITTIEITQDLEEACRADRVIVLEQGRILMDATPDAVFAEEDSLRAIGLEAPFLFTLARKISAVGTVPVRPSLSDLAERVVDLCGVRRRGCFGSPPSGRIDNGGTRPCLQVEEIHFSYEAGPGRRIRALEGVTASLATGGSVGIIGRSGSGKSTLAQHLNGLLAPDRGRVLLDHGDLSDPSVAAGIRRRIGLVFQYPEVQLFEETVAADVAFGPVSAGCDEEETQRRVRAALKAVALPPEQYGSRPPTALSGGERRRAAIAGVLAMETEVLVMDEPTAGLDPAGFAGLLDLLARLRKQGVVQVLVTHDVRLVAAATAWVVALDRGRVALEGKTEEVLTHPEFSRLTGLEPPPAVRFAQQLAAAGLQVAPGITRQQQVLDFMDVLTGDTDE